MTRTRQPSEQTALDPHGPDDAGARRLRRIRPGRPRPDDAARPRPARRRRRRHPRPHDSEADVRRARPPRRRDHRRRPRRAGPGADPGGARQARRQGREVRRVPAASSCASWTATPRPSTASSRRSVPAARPASASTSCPGSPPSPPGRRMPVSPSRRSRPGAPRPRRRPSVSTRPATPRTTTPSCSSAAPTSIRAGLAGLLAAGRPAESPVALVDGARRCASRPSPTTLGDAERVFGGKEAFDVTMAVVSPNVDLRDEFSWFETKPLFGWKVLVPRTQAQAGPMVDRLAGYGATADVVPTISVEPPRTPQQMEKAVKGLVTGRYEWIGFTSVNAVRAVRERFEELGLDARAFAGLKVAAVGGVTADALREWGINPDLVPSGEQSAAGLLEDVAASSTRSSTRSTGSCCPAPTSRPRRSSPVCATWAGRSTTSRPTAPSAPRRRRQIRDAIKGGDYDAVVFTSSSTVRNLVGIAGKPHAATVVACTLASGLRCLPTPSRQCGSRPRSWYSRPVPRDPPRASVSALPGADAGLVALGVGEHPERRGRGRRSPGCRPPPALASIRACATSGGTRDVEVQPLPVGISESVCWNHRSAMCRRRPRVVVVGRTVRQPQDRLPERPDPHRSAVSSASSRTWTADGSAATPCRRPGR